MITGMYSLRNFSVMITDWATWVLPEDYCKKDPFNFNAETFVSKVGNLCPTLGQLLARPILYVLLVGEKQHEIARARFCTQSCSKIGQLLVNSIPTPHPMGSCGGFPCRSPLPTPEQQIFAVVVLQIIQ